MNLPGALIESLENTKGFHRSGFETAHGATAPPVSIRLNPLRNCTVNDLLFADLVEEPVPWSRYGYYLKERPSFTFDPLFHAGCYYVQEASSMFLEQFVTRFVDEGASLRVLDLSAAPGGKSTHLLSLLPKNSLLVSNEVIHSRARILEDNLVKWGASNLVITRNDPADFSALPAFFDLMLVDAPCSGSGLFRKDPQAAEGWSPELVRLCRGRQQRILADAWPALAPGGILLYSTCSYSEEENEKIGRWIEAGLHAEEIEVPLAKEWGITESAPGYRFWPDQVKGEGFYFAAFRKGGEADSRKLRKPKRGLQRPVAAEKAVLKNWVDDTGLELVLAGKNIYAWPLALAEEIEHLAAALNVIYSGVRVGELVRSGLVPDHALAMSGILLPGIRGVEADLVQAIDYLSRKELTISTAEKGWQLLCFRGKPLGWINVLANRINNYYPKGLRILKDSP